MDWQGPGDLRAAVEGRARRFPGTFTFFAKNLDTGETVGRGADVVMPPASVIKLAAMATAYRMAHEGGLDLSRRVSLGVGDRYPGSGVLRYLEDGVSLSFRDLIRLMIAVSDNVATRQVLSAVGVGPMNDYMAALGLPNTRMIIPPRPKEGPRGQGSTTARELVRLLTLMASGELVGEYESREMREHLRCQQYGDQVARFLPFNLYAADRGEPSRVRVLNKTGFSIGVRSDAAIIEVEGA
jgi:beta-lactamase class A